MSRQDSICVLLVLFVNQFLAAREPQPFKPTALQIYYGNDAAIRTQMADQMASGHVVVVETRGIAKNELDRLIQRADAVGAKVLCSAEFVVGRDAHEYARNDDFPPIIGTGRVEIHVDREAKRVELWLDGGRVRKRAMYNGDQGCSIIPDGEDGIFFTPVDVVSGLPDPTTQRWPMGDVVPDDPIDPTVDQEALEAAVDMAFEPEAGKPRSFLVVHKGNIIAERYAPGFDKDTRNVSWSMGKSITATLFALLVREGHHKVSDLAPIAGWRDPEDPRKPLQVSGLPRSPGRTKSGSRISST